MSAANAVAQLTEDYETRYRSRTAKSRALGERARTFMPGGETRAGTWFSPYPIWIGEADGCRIRDADGNHYIDFHGNYSSAILGHSNPAVVAAVQRQAQVGASLAGLTPNVIRWAELLCTRVRSVSRVRFTCSGTEAVMTAVRLARVLSRKDVIVKTEGAYHGVYDPVCYPTDGPGVPRSAFADSIVVPYNNVESMERVIHEHRAEIAAVIVEGALGTNGMIFPKEGYLESIREITRRLGIILILDEIITFRLAPGGMQEIRTLDADITTLGKVIGGGYPVGAVGGREDLMAAFSPESRQLHHSGTFVANPVVAAAGVATLEQLTPQQIQRINGLGESLKSGLVTVLRKVKVRGHVTGLGSLQNLHFGPVEPSDMSSLNNTNRELLRVFHLGMLERGIYMAARGLFSISTPMEAREVGDALAAAEDTLRELRPAVERLWPQMGL